MIHLNDQDESNNIHLSDENLVFITNALFSNSDDPAVIRPNDPQRCDQITLINTICSTFAFSPEHLTGRSIFLFLTQADLEEKCKHLTNCCGVVNTKKFPIWLVNHSDTLEPNAYGYLCDSFYKPTHSLNF
ncbi:hypothetical protein PPL_01067 [Heterostelium album PN500]|uniref:Uncharacterized protein n=1 Tax=Heterostelium pallidum (strain ATCC 26659 / Pp 5 / PN500) TaxID=670386 RepID=D3AY09_HETP5|nr:hypothetical protein PPL_01067 [Heterostelium album PN500]EFA85836.1 hypothetical protein PPL_01067 [Heterostelium album PN500]|eukprot:XP_020437942.1 hypothetical protein PPL_01067 [Heterostelium album PN500]